MNFFKIVSSTTVVPILMRTNPVYRKMFVKFMAIALFFGMSFSATMTANSQEFPITFNGLNVGAIERFKIDNIDPNRIVFLTNIRFDSLPENIDTYLRQRGDFISGCSKRLYWVGNTSIRGVGTTLKLSSRARYEQWTCIKVLGKRIKTRLIQDTKTLDWDLSLEQNGIEFAVIARLTNIRNFPNFLENEFRLRVEKEIKIPIPSRCGKCWCRDIQANLDLKLEKADFSQRSDGKINLEVAISLKNDVMALVGCL